MSSSKSSTVGPDVFQLATSAVAAATTIAIGAPEAVHIVPAGLGHAGPEISERYYNLAGSVEASRRYHAILAELRQKQSNADHC